MTLLDFTIRISAAVLFGLAIGLERQLKGHPAGIHTNILVSLGSSIFVIFSFMVDAPDTTRIAAQIVTGVGFLCSSIIFKDGVNVRGINTAATIWCVAAIGILTSMGKIQYALVATLLVVTINFLLGLISDKLNPNFQFGKNDKYYKIKVTCSESEEKVIRGIIINYISNSELILTDLESKSIEKDKIKILAKIIYNKSRKDDIVEELICIINNEQDITSVGWELM